MTKSSIYASARPWLAPLVPLYQFGLTLRELQFRSGLKPIRRLRWPVVSIGNLSTGGSGKTPLTITLAKALTARGLLVDVLSRGYGRRSALSTLVDPMGTAEEFGDEPLLIAREAGVPVFVATERYQAGLLAEKASQQVSESASQQVRVHLLDDGFQHRQLARDINILLLSRADLTGHLLPAGNLREPLRANRRAAAVIAIRAGSAGLGDRAHRADHGRATAMSYFIFSMPSTASVDATAVERNSLPTRPSTSFSGAPRFVAHFDQSRPSSKSCETLPSAPVSAL